MTSKNSLINLFIQRFIQNIWLLMLNFVIMFIIMPFITFFSGQSGQTYTSIHLIIYFSQILAILTSISMFRYTHSKSQNDFYHSLPIKREKLFLINYILGIFLYILPFFINVLLNSLCLASFSNLSSDIFSLIIPSIAYFLVIYSLNTFSVIISGNLFVSTCITVGLSFLTTILSIFPKGIFSLFLDNYVMSNSDAITIHTNPLMSPLWFGKSYKIIFSMPIIAIIFFILSIFCYKKRASENCTNPIAIDIFKPIIKFMGVLCASLMGGEFVVNVSNIDTAPNKAITYIFGFIFIGFLFHLAFEVLFSLDFKKLFNNLYQFIIYSVISVVLILCVVFDITNFNTRLPSLNKIEKATITVGDYGQSAEIYENVDLVYNISNEIKGNKNLQNNVIIDFTLQNGKHFKRRYTYNVAENIENITKTAEYIASSGNYNIVAPKFTQIDIYHLDGYTTLESNVNEIYNLIKEESINLSYDYISNNLPVLNLEFIELNSENHYANYTTVPIYKNFTKTIEYLNQKGIVTDKNITEEMVSDISISGESVNASDYDDILEKIIYITVEKYGTINYSNAKKVQITYNLDNTNSIIYGYINK